MALRFRSGIAATIEPTTRLLSRASLPAPATATSRFVTDDCQSGFERRARLEINRDLAASHLPEMISHVLGSVPKTSFESAFHLDLVHHEHDLLGAAGTPRQFPLRADVAAMRAQLTNVRLRFAADRLSTLRISPTDTDRFWDVGTGAPSAWVSAPVFGLLRTFRGRRTLEESGVGGLCRPGRRHS